MQSCQGSVEPMLLITYGVKTNIEVWMNSRSLKTLKKDFLSLEHHKQTCTLVIILSKNKYTGQCSPQAVFFPANP